MRQFIVTIDPDDWPAFVVAANASGKAYGKFIVFLIQQAIRRFK